MAGAPATVVAMIVVAAGAAVTKAATKAVKVVSVVAAISAPAVEASHCVAFSAVWIRIPKRTSIPEATSMLTDKQRGRFVGRAVPVGN